MSGNLGCLPIEILSIIAEWVRVGEGSLAALAATNRRCQVAAEAITFRSLTIISEELPTFSSIVTTTRFQALRNLRYDIHGPDNHEDDADSENLFRTTAADFEACSLYFTRAIVDLLTTLKAKSIVVPETYGGLTLHLASWLVPKALYLSEDSKVHTSGDDNVTIPSTLRRGWVRLREELLCVECTVPTIKTLSFRDPTDNHDPRWDIWTASLPVIASHLPRLNVVDWSASDNERKDLSGRREAHDAFGRSLVLVPRSVNELHLVYMSRPPNDQLYAPPRLTDTILRYDVFSHEMGTLSQRLVKLRLDNATLDLEDFFRADHSKTWDHLQYLDLFSVQAASPDGSYYFDRDPRLSQEEIDGEWDSQAPDLEAMREYMMEDELPGPMDVQLRPFRSSMSPSHFERIYLACAEAVKRMPMLQCLLISFEVGVSTKYGDGYHSFGYRHGPATAQDYWCKTSVADIKVGWDLVPMIDIDGEVRRAWKEVGEAKQASIELFQSNGLPFGDMFQRLE